MSTDFKLALRYAWLLLAVAMLCAVGLPFVSSPAALQALTPACEARAKGGSCMLCGMTTAFFAISRGDFAQAQMLNAGAVPLYAGFCVNALLAILYGGRKCK